MELGGITGGGNFQRSKKFLSAYRPHKLNNTRGKSFTSFLRVGDVTRIKHSHRVLLTNQRNNSLNMLVLYINHELRSFTRELQVIILYVRFCCLGFLRKLLAAHLMTSKPVRTHLIPNTAVIIYDPH